MDRDKDSRPPRPNGRPLGLVVKTENRKPLFGKPRDNENAANGNASQGDATRPRTIGKPLPFHARKANSESHIAPTPLSERRGSNTSSVASTSSTRIPRPPSSSLSQRRDIGLAEALKLAEAEENDRYSQHPADASPSPAPRAWRSRSGSDNKSIRDGQGRETPSRGRLARLTSEKSEPRAAAQKKEQNGLHPAISTDNASADERGRETGKSSPAPAERTKSNGALSGLFRRRSPAKRIDPESEVVIPPLAPGINDPLPSIEGTPRTENALRQSTLQPPPSAMSVGPSPEKNFAWLEQDFTAGDLQVSDSPRIRFPRQPFADRLSFDDSSNVEIESNNRVNPPGKLNTKLDEIRRREVKQGVDSPSEKPNKNTALEDILAREARAEQEIPIPDRHLSRLQNTKLDDIRQREEDGLSRRTLASVRLGEIREQNSQPRSKSPEEARPHSSDEPSEKIVPPERSKSAFEGEGQRIPNTPVTIFKKAKFELGKESSEDQESKPDSESTKDAYQRPLPNRADSKDLLSRLARAASNSPSAEPETKILPTALKADRPWTEKMIARNAVAQESGEDKKPANETKERGSLRPTVGFAEFDGLRRVRSTESTRSKRTSLHSEDPEDRIEGEKNLFALMDNYSERGSVRAPSPEGGQDNKDDEADMEATPKPKKPDPLTMPTPRVTGAYVETPATVKVEDRWEKKALPALDKAVAPRPSLLNKNPAVGMRRRSRDSDTASDPGVEVKSAAASSSAAASKPRARSLSRRRAPLRNSAKPHSVKDDLLELQRANNIEDSTTDDFDDLFSGRKSASPKLEESQLVDEMLKAITAKSMHPEIKNEDLDDPKPKTKSRFDDVNNDRWNSDSETMDRMAKALKTGIMGIRTAKQGIERLEDQFSHTSKATALVKEETSTDTAPAITKKIVEPLEVLESRNSHWTYLRVPVPLLYRRTPKFKLTLLGLVVFLASLWLVAESSMCAAFCRPQVCRSQPCVWSYEDPTFGKAIPVKLDQWTTGGQGRSMLSQLSENFSDWFADMEDLALGQDITDRDPRTMSFYQRRQHRRRLDKKGLIKTKEPTPEQKARWDAWHQTRLNQERIKAAREMGYHVEEEGDASIGGDRRVG